jgi:hypothetical protein
MTGVACGNISAIYSELVAEPDYAALLDSKFVDNVASSAVLTCDSFGLAITRCVFRGRGPYFGGFILSDLLGLKYNVQDCEFSESISNAAITFTSNYRVNPQATTWVLCFFATAFCPAALCPTSGFATSCALKPSLAPLRNTGPFAKSVWTPSNAVVASDVAATYRRDDTGGFSGSKTFTSSHC